MRSYVSQSNWVALLTAGATGRSLHAGTTGADVTRVQRAMNAAGSPYLKITGTYGLATRNAVGNYQKRSGSPGHEDRGGAHVGGPAQREDVTLRRVAGQPARC